VIVRTGRDTEIGAIAERLQQPQPETDFERGLRQFGYLLTRVAAVMVVAVFAVHMYFERPLLESLLFAIALAVGLSPELLPAILTVTLARGAHSMAKRGVIVRRLNAIENLGSMDVLCTDKTGTLTEGVVRVELACDARGVASAAVLRAAGINARSRPASPIRSTRRFCQPPATWRGRTWSNSTRFLRLHAQAPQRRRARSRCRAARA